MYQQSIPQDLAFYMLYGASAMQSLIACIYLLFRQGNAFSADVTPPVRLRRWTAAFFAGMTLSHLWYLPVASPVYNFDAIQSYLVGGLLDSLTVFPLAIIIMFVMLQDRKRPLWPVVLMVSPLCFGMVWCLLVHSAAPIQWLYLYIPLLGLGLIVYLVCEVRRYGRWLRDNFVDLEHKELWQSYLIMALILSLFGFYVFGLGVTGYEYVVQVFDIIVVGFLLWRIETLSDLSIQQSQSFTAEEEAAVDELLEGGELTSANYDAVGLLLQKRCIDTHLYLEHDLTLIQLAKLIGTNRSYLSQYFASQNTTYNAYINDLRIQHFMNLYRQAIADGRDFTALQLATDSGYRSYSTFSLAFKRQTGMSVSLWMKSQ